MRQGFVLHIFAFICTAIFVILMLKDPSWFREHVESKTYDLRLSIRSALMDTAAPEDIVIVTIDEKSIAEMGRWPWQRDVMARLVRKISEGGPLAIGIDILFTEAESSATDGELAKALAEAGNAVLATGFIVSKKEAAGIGPVETDILWDHAFSVVRDNKKLNWRAFVLEPETVLIPLRKLAEGATLGSVYSQPDRDGTIRWEILYLHFDEDFYATMPLQVARIALGLAPDQMELVGGTGVALGETTIRTDLNGRALINYFGPEGTFRYIPAVDLMQGRVDPVELSGKVVMLGTSAVATYDQKVTPLSANMPGIEKNATVVDNIIRSRFLKRSPGFMEIIITILTAIALSLLLQRMRALKGFVLGMAFIFLYVLFAFYVFIGHGVWISLLLPTMNMFMIFTAQTTAKYVLEERKAKRMRAMFSSYVSPRVVETLINNPEMARLGGHRKEITVLFSDIAGFTSLSEKHEPEEIVSLLNEYFKAMTDVIFHWEGTFDKIVGDEIMAFWGAPIDQPNHAELAVRCSLDMMKTLSRLQAKWESEGKPVLRCGIGLNTGVVIVGNIGAEDKKMDYTVIGDHVNTGARVEALTRQFEADILMTQHTAKRIKPLIDAGRFGHLELVHRGGAKVKGKAEELPIFELKDKPQGPRNPGD